MQSLQHSVAGRSTSRPASHAAPHARPCSRAALCPTREPHANSGPAAAPTPPAGRLAVCRSASPAAEAATPAPPPPSAAPAEVAVAGADGPSFTLQCGETGTAIHVFGVEHLEPQPHIGEWIIRQRPDAVVVETAMGPEHGAVAGNVIRCGDPVADPTAAFFLRMFCQIGVTLQEFKDGDFTASPLWNQVRTSYNGEQLAYIGAFTTGAPLVFGDRPKDITYRRLFGLTTLPQLDQGYSYAAVQNYRSFLGLPPLPYDPDSLPVTEQIMMQEREAVMLKVVHQLCHNTLPQQHLTLQGGRTSPEHIALVVGSAHLPGLQQLWESGRWREVVGSGSVATPLAASQLLYTPPLTDPETDPLYGLRRGLVAAMLRLSVTREVLANLDTVLGPVPPRHSVAYDAVGEVYGSPRMQLASLDRELLGRVVEGLRGGEDFYEVLEPLRAIRPLQGGPGYSEDMVTYVRALNFELD